MVGLAQLAADLFILFIQYFAQNSGDSSFQVSITVPSPHER